MTADGPWAVYDDDAVYGVGPTRDAALQDAAAWVTDEDEEQGVPTDAVHRMVEDADDALDVSPATHRLVKRVEDRGGLIVFRTRDDGRIDLPTHKEVD